MSEQHTPEPACEETKERGLFPDLEELRLEVEKRIRDNRRFLERFLDDDFEDELEPEDGEEPFEEL
jgi:hypothetical protein